MQSFAQALDLKDDPELMRVYREHHRAVWPEVVRGLRAIGIRRMKLYLVGTRLFMYCEADDSFSASRDYQTYAKDPRTRAWDELMRGFQKRLPQAKGEEWWTPMECVFDLESASA